MILIVAGIYWRNYPRPFLLHSLLHLFCLAGLRFLLWRSKFFFFLFSFSCTIFYLSVLYLFFCSTIYSFSFFLLFLLTRCIFLLPLFCLFRCSRRKFTWLTFRSSSLKNNYRVTFYLKNSSLTVQLPSFARGLAPGGGVLDIVFGFLSLVSCFFEDGELQNQFYKEIILKTKENDTTLK